jgi:DNA-binding MarR family transcriptional regulator
MTIDDCLSRHLAQAALQLRLDEELGNWHGLSWADFVLLHVLQGLPEGRTTAELARHLGLAPSALVLRLLPLEKIGLLAREQGPGGVRRVVLCPGGERLVREARITAEATCAAA